MTKVYSLRSRLFVLIIAPLVLVAAAASIVRFWFAEETSQQLYDDTLSVVALTISRDVVLSEGDILADELLGRLVGALGDPIFYRVTGPDGRFLTGYSDAPAADGIDDLPTGIVAFHDSSYHGEPVRVAVLREFISGAEIGGWTTVQVWQTVKRREQLSLQLFYRTLGILTLVTLTAAGLVWFGINLGLKPLTDLREAILLRSPSDLRPIRRPVPREVKPLVDASNALFAGLKSAFAQRDAFISNAAHQLRNPIAGIQAQAEAAEGAASETELRRRVGEVTEAARQASRLTQQLLSLDKATQRPSAVLAERVELRELAASIVRAHAPEALRRSVEISFQESEAPIEVQGDRVLLGEAIENLVDNALRYGCKDGGALDVAVTSHDGQAFVVVDDAGPGVTGDQVEKIFERFHRAYDDGGDGCGLGLSIVRTIAERHGGRVRLVPKTTAGSRFELSLPLADRPNADG